MTCTLRASLEAANPAGNPAFSPGLEDPRKLAAGSISPLFGNPRDGVAWPYPRIFPGASAPYLWRPGGASPSGFASARRRLSISTSARLPPPLRPCRHAPPRLFGPSRPSAIAPPPIRIEALPLCLPIQEVSSPSTTTPLRTLLPTRSLPRLTPPHP